MNLSYILEDVDSHTVGVEHQGFVGLGLVGREFHGAFRSTAAVGDPDDDPHARHSPQKDVWAVIGMPHSLRDEKVGGYRRHFPQ